MDNLNHILLGMSSSFKLPNQISPADRETVKAAFENLVGKLPGFFRALEPGQPNEVEIEALPVKGEPRYSHRYIQVIKHISDIMGTHLYCKELLAEDDLQPIQQIYVIGPKAERTLVKMASKYLYLMKEGIKKSSRFATRETLNGKQHNEKVEKEVYVGIMVYLRDYLDLRKKHAPKLGREIRDEKIWTFMKFNVKLHYNRNRKGFKEGNPNVYDATTNGVFKPNMLL